MENYDRWLKMIKKEEKRKKRTLFWDNLQIVFSSILLSLIVLMLIFFLVKNLTETSALYPKWLISLLKACNFNQKKLKFYRHLSQIKSVKRKTLHLSVVKKILKAQWNLLFQVDQIDRVAISFISRLKACIKARNGTWTSC